ncbi:hypothetical protein [Sphingomonas sp. 2378]
MLEEAANRAFGVTVTPDQGHMAGYGDFDRAVAVIDGTTTPPIVAPAR